MGSSHDTCETCAKICDDAKKNVKKLENKLQTLTIVCTASITLLGEHGAKALFDAVSSFTKIQEIASGKESSKETNQNDTNQNQKDNNKQGDKVALGSWKPYNKPNNQNNKESADAAKALDGLARISKQNTNQKADQPQVTGDAEVTKQIVKAATTTNEELQVPDQLIPRFPVPADPYAVFLTPSAMPFDVYSTTLGLGNNYGFGDYYGIDTSNYSGSPTPSANTISFFALGSFFNTRKRV